MSEISQLGKTRALWNFGVMAAPKKKPFDNSALLTHLAVRQPGDMSIAQWLQAADVNSSYFTDLRKGVEPSIYKVERLAAVAGLRLSEFWRGVEMIRYEIERRKADEMIEAGENVVSVGPAQRRAARTESQKRRTA
jgi:hypothetical protein